jgi:hypothetical protein
MENARTPPPLPEKTNPLQYAHFEASKSGIHTAGFDRERLESARRQALAWINQNPGIEIVSIDSAFGHMLAIVTVWFR